MVSRRVLEAGWVQAFPIEPLAHISKHGSVAAEEAIYRYRSVFGESGKGRTLNSLSDTHRVKAFLQYLYVHLVS